jgi:2-polyprenyl-3-methyl-5-hydroxy-6-metoxy-1,4-benzoquinol methylase
MSLLSGERQVAHSFTGIKGIRGDHTTRYYWANSFLKKGDSVLDACCGVGYGSFIMSVTSLPESIVAFDGDAETIEYAKKWYHSPRIEYYCIDCDEVALGIKVFDKIVFFEAIEHLDNPTNILCEFHSALKDDGLLLISTPNGAKLPFDKKRFPEHLLHYTSDQLESLLNSCGFKVDQWLSQPHKVSLSMDNNLEGIFMLCVASKL